MITDIEILRSAAAAIKAYAADAELMAEERIEVMMQSGDVEGALTWKRILTAIVEQRKLLPD